MQHTECKSDIDQPSGVPEKKTFPINCLSEIEGFLATPMKVKKFFVNLEKASVPAYPSHQELETLAKSLDKRPNGFKRLLLLLQNIGNEKGWVVDSVIKLAELTLTVNGVIGNENANTEEGYLEIGKSWIAKTSWKRCNRKQRELFLIFILVGWRKSLIHESEILPIFRSIFKTPKRKQKSIQTEAPESAINIFLKISGGKPDLKALLDLSEAWRRRVWDQEEISENANRAKEAAEKAKGDLNFAVEKLRGELHQVLAIQEALRNHNAELEKNLSDVKTEYQHKIDEIRGRLKGILDGELSRWLQNAYEAAIDAPPRVEVIKERIESSISLIRRQIEWLRTSD